MNAAVKHAQWGLARMLGARALLVSVLEANVRAAAAVARLWPEVAPQRVFAQWRRRWALVWELSSPPALPAPPVAGLWDATGHWRAARIVAAPMAIDGELPAVP